MFNSADIKVGKCLIFCIIMVGKCLIVVCIVQWEYRKEKQEIILAYLHDDVYTKNSADKN